MPERSGEIPGSIRRTQKHSRADEVVMKSEKNPLNKTDRQASGIKSSASLLARGLLGDQPPGISRAVAAMLGLATPIAIGALAGHPRIGMVASLGGLAMSSSGGETFRQQVKVLIFTLAAGSLAMFTGVALAGRGMVTSLSIPAIAALMGLIGGISMPLVRLTTLFNLYMIIAGGIGSRGVHPLPVMILFSVGALWTMGLALALRPLFRIMHLEAAPANVEPPPRYPFRLLLRRWRKNLAHLSGWHYTIRITSCLLAAQVFEWTFPEHHAYWVSITVVIVVHRNLKAALPRTLHRAAGTALGVLLISLLMLGSPSTWFMIALIAALAAARPFLIQANYTAYATVMTPLVILLLDFGHDPSWALIIDRLAATLVGCLLSLTLGYLAWYKVSLPAPVTPVSKVTAAMNVE